MIDDIVIELKELRIGNLLEYKGQVVEVTMLSRDIDDEYEDQICFVKYGTISNEMGGWNRSVAKDLERIPLTPEWLERIGMELRTQDKVWQIQIGNSCYFEIEAEEPFMCGVTPETWRDQCPVYIWNEVKYVHQLQNVFYFLTGQELQIKLQ